MELKTKPKTKRWKKVHCDQCQVLVINNVVCHEHGCPTQRKKRLILGRWV